MERKVNCWVSRLWSFYRKVRTPLCKIITKFKICLFILKIISVMMTFNVLVSNSRLWSIMLEISEHIEKFLAVACQPLNVPPTKGASQSQQQQSIAIATHRWASKPAVDLTASAFYLLRHSSACRDAVLDFLSTLVQECLSMFLMQLDSASGSKFKQNSLEYLRSSLATFKLFISNIWLPPP